MLIGKRVTLFLIFGSLFSGCTSLESKAALENPEQAWWVLKQFKAEEDNIYGIPLSKINNDWELVTILSAEYFKENLPESQYNDIQNSKLVSNIDVKLDQLLGAVTFFVGVFESYSGETGRFVAIKQGSDIIKYFTHSGIAGYSSIYLDSSKLRWYKCLDCNDFDVINWDGRNYFLQ